MLAELAAANAAFSIIKQAISNGSELAAAGKQVADFAMAKDGLQKKINKKKGSGNGSDLAEFMALEQIKQKENELREIMIWAGRPGLWKDWQAFQANASAARSAAQKKRRLTLKVRSCVTELTWLLPPYCSFLLSVVYLAELFT